MSHTYRHTCRFFGPLIFTLAVGHSLASAQTQRHSGKTNDLQSRRLQMVQADIVLAQRAIRALKKLRANVVVHRSLGQFEQDGRLAHVSFNTFAQKLDEITLEIEPLLYKVSDAKLRSHLINAVASYRDGAFWWSNLDQTTVVNVTNLKNPFTSTTPADRFLTSTIPYTVAIHWRLADKYLVKAEELLATLSLRMTPELSSDQISMDRSDDRD